MPDSFFYSLFSSTVCTIKPQHIGPLKAFGTVLLIGAVISLITGKTFFRRIISKEDEPGKFWSVLIGNYLILSIFLLGGVYICRSG